MVGRAVNLKVLVTRPEPGASATGERIRRLGHHPILSPCLVITARRARLPARADAVVITSAQALPALAQLPRQIEIFTVGEATAAQAREAGFCAVTSAGGTAADLAVLVKGRLPPGTNLFFPTGAGNGLLLANMLREAGFCVHRRVAYRASPATSLTEEALAGLDAGVIDRVLVFSQATGRCFSALVRQSGRTNALRRSIAIAISSQAAASLENLPFASIETAIAPDQEHMLAMLP